MARHDQFNRPDVGMAAIGGIAVSLRGVAYDLMQLNPDGTAAENFVIDPFSPPGVAGALPNIAPGVVGPYVCTGQLGMPRVTGGALTVGRPFPLASLFNQFNSRFDQYTGALCSYSTAPPDTNIRQYAFGAAGSGTPWMSVAPAGQVAQSTTVNGKLWTVADPLPQPPGTTGPMYGPLWAYARAVPYSSYVAGAAEPAAATRRFPPAPGARCTGRGRPPPPRRAPGAARRPTGPSAAPTSRRRRWRARAPPGAAC